MERTEFNYGVHELEVEEAKPIGETVMVLLSNGINYGSQCFHDAQVGDVYRVRIEKGSALGIIHEGIRVSERK
jgi:hypothetical protein